MKTLYIECKMGVAGDMLCAALYDLLSSNEKELFLKQMNLAFGNDLQYCPQIESRCGISGTHMHVLIRGEEEFSSTLQDSSAIDQGNTYVKAHAHTHASTHEHMHYDYNSILNQIETLPFTASVKQHIKEVYLLLGDAESMVHGQPLSQIHFHEVGSLDAIADISACCYLLELLSPDQVIASPIHVGNGTVHCSHGILPVPAPATAELLKGIPYYTGTISSELATPTGVAILKHFCSTFMNMEPMTVSGIGVGLGTKEFAQANCLRAFLGNTTTESSQIVELTCNIDDMTGEELGFLMDLLIKQGALDVYFESVHMKKNRPGVVIHCLCKPEEKDNFLTLLLQNSSTRGIRYLLYDRATMDYTIIEKTPNSVPSDKK